MTNAFRRETSSAPKARARSTPRSPRRRSSAPSGRRLLLAATLAIALLADRLAEAFAERLSRLHELTATLASALTEEEERTYTEALAA